MASRRSQLREAYAALDQASDHAAWQAAAEEHDRITGAAAWRADDASPHYDAVALRASIDRLRAVRESGDGVRLAGALTDDLYRHLNDLTAPALYEVALAGTKHVVEQYLDEAVRCLWWLAETEVPGVPRAEKLRRFEAAHGVFGRSALMLSGGATWGFHHLGVVKALFELGLLPHILSGASTGAMIAAAVCARSDDELTALFTDTDAIRLDGLRWVGLRPALRAGAALDPAHLYEVLRANCTELTFAEAFARSGRALNISVSPTRSRQKPRLLTHLTAPDVLVASAAVASSAVPGLFPPVVLHQRGADGEVAAYAPEERWVDGSLVGDLPKQRLARLHNVNHFIVSQTNPHVLPFVRHHGRHGIRATAAAVASVTVRAQSAYAADVARRVGPRGPLGQAADQAYALLSQDYAGDITLHPQFHVASYRRVVANPTREDLARFIREGERAVWPMVARIRNETAVGSAFRACIAALRAGS